jgi:hypothetical protein
MLVLKHSPFSIKDGRVLWPTVGSVNLFLYIWLFAYVIFFYWLILTSLLYSLLDYMLLHCTKCNYEKGNVGCCKSATYTAKTTWLSFCVFITVTNFLLKNLQHSNFDVLRRSRNDQQEMMRLRTNQSVTLLDSIVSGIWAWLASCNCRYIQGGIVRTMDLPEVRSYK